MISDQKVYSRRRRSFGYARGNVLAYMDSKVFCKPEEISSRVNITAKTFLAVVSHSSEYDIKALPGHLSSPARYIGVMRSRRRWQLTAEALISQGIMQDVLSHISTPIGLKSILRLQKRSPSAFFAR